MTTASPEFAQWSPLERESFFVAIARHRRAAWRVTAVSALANSLLALVVAVLMSPLFYALLAIALDLVNLIYPIPDWAAQIGARLDQATDHPQSVSAGRWACWILIAALPGLAWMSLVMALIARALHAATAFEAVGLCTRLPDSTALPEQRLVNVIGEMALAAGLQAPRVRVTARRVINAAVVGSRDGEVTIIVSESLLASLSREQLQGVAADLIASVANGDLEIGLRAALSQCLFGFTERMGSLFSGQVEWRRWRRMMLVLFRPQGNQARQLVADILDPFAPSKGETPQRSTASRQRTTDSSRLTWREWMAAPFFGPLVLTGLVGGIVAQLLLAPLLALVWRERKYMADATAVRLTRDPNALAEALARMDGAGRGRYESAVLAPMLAHLSVVFDQSTTGLLSSPFASMFPQLRKRLGLLAKMGAHVDPGAIQSGWELSPTWSVALGIARVACGLTAAVLLVFMSTVLTMIFTGAPFVMLHMLLRLL
jgi:Zn-dependent protease with chaperone function